MTRPGAWLAALAALLLLALPAAAQMLRLGVPLEPPNLDPTTGAAAAVDEVVLYNLFEGLTRIAPDGSVIVTVTPCTGADTIHNIMLVMVREIFGNFSSWRIKDEAEKRLPEIYKRLGIPVPAAK